MLHEADAADIVVVCHANVCRSPLAELLIANAVASEGWRVQSRGTHAHDGQGLCPAAGAELSRIPGGPSYAATFRSRRLRAIDLASPMLLAASVEEKSALAKLDHTVRARTFTLIEAALLAEADAAVPSDHAADLRALVRRWDGLRRSADSPLPRVYGALDAPDAHLGRGVRHEQTLGAVSTAANRLIAVLSSSGSLSNGSAEQMTSS